MSKLYNLNVHPHEAVSRYRDPQLQVGTTFKSSKFNAYFLNK